MTLQILEPELTQASPARGVRITLKHLGNSYSGRQVSKNIDLDIAPGEFVAIVGRSGCGKRTLLRLVAGLEQTNDGSIRFEQDGKDHTPEIRFMFQDSRLLPWKRVLDNVALGLTEGKETASQVAWAV